MTYSDDRHIGYILDNFDFENVEKVMLNINWIWPLVSNKPPNIKQLKITARELLENCLNQETGYSCSTGGFTAFKFDDSLQLTFSVDDVDSYVLNINDKYERDKKNKERKIKIDSIKNKNKCGLSS